MKISFGRWVAGTAIACVALGVAILPADGSPRFVSWLDVRRRSPEEAWQQRMYARQNHVSEVVRVYKGTRELTAARRAFAGSSGRIGVPEIRFADDVSAPMRIAISRALDDERTQKGALTAHGKVGVFVAVDTALHANGVEVRALRRGSDITVTSVYPPTSLTGDRCLVIVRIPGGDPWSKMFEGRAVGPVHPLLDACGYYDSFGAPSTAVANELADSRFFFARGYVTSVPPDTAQHPRRYAWSGWWGEGTREGRCLAGSDRACLDEWSGLPPQDAPLGGHAPLQESLGGSSVQPVRRVIRGISLLNRVAQYVGPQRFARMWQSPKALEDSFLTETGEPLASFVRGVDQHDDGVYRAGPWTSGLSTALTLFAIIVMFGSALRFGRRPGTS